MIPSIDVIELDQPLTARCSKGILITPEIKSQPIHWLTTTHTVTGQGINKETLQPKGQQIENPGKFDPIVLSCTITTCIAFSLLIFQVLLQWLIQPVVFPHLLFSPAGCTLINKYKEHHIGYLCKLMILKRKWKKDTV